MQFYRLQKSPSRKQTGSARATTGRPPNTWLQSRGLSARNIKWSRLYTKMLNNTSTLILTQKNIIRLWDPGTTRRAQEEMEWSEPIVSTDDPHSTGGHHRTQEKETELRGSAHTNRERYQEAEQRLHLCVGMRDWMWLIIRHSQRNNVW